MASIRNKIQHWRLQFQQHRKLVLAVLPSLLIHLLLITLFSFELPELDNDTQMIEARLVNLDTPKAIPQVPPKPKKIAEKSAQTPTDPMANKPPAPEPETALSSKTETSSLGTFSSATLNMGNASTEAADAQQLDENAPYEFEADPEIIRYTRAEAEFEVKRGNDATAAGISVIAFNIDKNNRYTIHSQTEAKGLVSLFFGTLTQKSEGTVTDAGLKPDFFSYQYGSGTKKLQTASFDWDKYVLTLRNAKGESAVKLVDGTQDFLSFMYQFMFAPPLNNLQITMTNGKKLRTYDYAFVGEETIQSKFGELKTVHLLKSSDDDEKTELWLATDYQYLPVKIRKTEKDGTVIEQLISKLSTSQTQ